MDFYAPLLLSGLIVIVGAALAVLIIFLLGSGGRRDTQLSAVQSAKSSKGGWRSWIGYIGLALVISLWSSFAGLFFLMVVWILRHDPNPNSFFTVSEKDKSTARRVYTWLFLSSFITVPFFLIQVISSYSSHTTNNQLVLNAIVPLLFHLPLLLGLTSKNAFIYRHTQQGILLSALRAGMAGLALTIGDSPDEGAWVFLLGNGSLWLFGSIWGWTQINRSECWWMRQKGEAILPLEGTDLTSTVMRERLSPVAHLAQSKSLKHNQKDVAKAHALLAFRLGSPEIKRQAVQVLEDAGEVESF